MFLKCIWALIVEPSRTDMLRTSCLMRGYPLHRFLLSVSAQLNFELLMGGVVQGQIVIVMDSPL